jgi:hypothetical protein
VADKRVGIVIEGKAAIDPAFRQIKREFNLLRAAGKQLNNVFTGIGQGIGQRVAGVAFDAFSQVTGLFTQAVPKALAYARSIDEIADATGASAEQSSILAGTLNLLGVPTEGLSTAFKSLSSEVVKSENKFAALGVTVRDGEGNLLDMVTILDSTRSKLGQMEDGAAKTAIAVDLFGKQALALIDYLNLSDEAAAGAADELERMGLVLDSKTITAAEDADRSMNLLGLTVQGLQITLANQLLPSIINIVNAIRNWVMENREGLLKTLASVAGAIGGFISGLLGATDAASSFINSLRGTSSAINTNKAGLQAQIAAIKQQIAAYKASGGASGIASGGASKVTAALTRQIQKLKDQRDAIRDVMRAQVEQAKTAFNAMLAGLDATERQYQLDERRKELAQDLADAEQEAADEKIKAQRDLANLRAERDLALAAESDLDKQFQVAIDYAEREQRLVEQYAEDQTRYEKAVADARANIAKFEAETKRQAAVDAARGQIQAAVDLSQRIQELALSDKDFAKNIADLRLIEQQQESALKIAIANGDSEAVRQIEINLALARDAIRAQEETKEIAAHQKRLEREKEKKAAVKSSNDAFLIALQSQLDGLEKQLAAQDANTEAIKGFRGEARKTVSEMQTQTPTVESFATAFADAATAGQNLADAINRIGDALGFLGTLGDIIGAVASPFGMIGQNLGGIGQTLGNIFGDTPAASPKPKAKPKPKPITGFPSGLVRARAMGGPVGAGQSYLVGEQGPELFVPGMGGSIVPGGGINVTLQAGAFLGSSSDAREFARRVYGAIEEESKRRFTVPPTIRRGAAA